MNHIKLPEELLTNSEWTSKKFQRLLLIIFVVLILILFLPWTQNIQSLGKVTTLTPDERPQEIHSMISGQLSVWKVKEGDWVNKGDTIAILKEMKSEFLNPDLLLQLSIQIKAKENSVIGYSSKIDAINNQIKTLENNRDISLKKFKLKIDQEKQKLQIEKADFDALGHAISIARNQYVRDSLLNVQKLKSNLELESRKLNYQNTNAKYNAQKLKLDFAESSILTAKLEYENVLNDYNEKLSKAESDRYTAVSNQMDAESELSKLRNTYASYKIRKDFAVIVSTTSGMIVQTFVQGVGETVKENDPICSISPSNSNKIIEFEISPNDIPLIQEGLPVQCIFDGWPTIVFNGWPSMSYGTFKSHVYAISNYPNKNGKYTVFAKPDKYSPWPINLKVGVGSRGYFLLKTVPIWYELWRQLNGFPPDFYKNTTQPEKK